MPVQREEVRIEREPITDANRDAALRRRSPKRSTRSRCTPRSPSSEKRTVPKERVRIDRDTVTDEQTVSEQVRKERIEADGDVDQRFRTEDDIAHNRPDRRVRGLIMNAARPEALHASGRRGFDNADGLRQPGSSPPPRLATWSLPP